MLMQPTFLPLLIIFAIAAIVGIGRGVGRLSRLRQRIDHSHTLAKWTEKPLSSWKYEPVSAGAATVHTVAVLIICAAAIYSASSSQSINSPFIANDSTMVILTWFSECGSIALMGYMAGMLMGPPIAAKRRKPIEMGLSADGVVYGSIVFKWQWFSYFSIDLQTRLIRLFSAYSPDLPSLTSKPPASIDLSEIEDTISHYLPSHPISKSLTWLQTKHMVIPVMVLICAPFDMAGWAMTRLPRTLGLFGMAVLILLLITLGGRLLSMYGYGVWRIRPAMPT